MKKTKTLQDILERLANLVGLACTYILAFLLVLVFINVVCRYFLRRPIVWSDELSMILLVWVTFLGSVIATKRGSHTRMELIDIIMPQSRQKPIKIFVNLITVIFLIGFIYSGLKMTSFVKHEYTEILHLPLVYAYWVLPVGGTLMLIYLLQSTLCKAGGFGKPRHEPNEEVE